MSKRARKPASLREATGLTSRIHSAAALPNVHYHSGHILLKTVNAERHSQKQKRRTHRLFERRRVAQLTMDRLAEGAFMPKEWELIANFESIELIKRDYKRRHGVTPNMGHARQIAAPFIHARSYFSSARTAAPTVKPLVLYYGVASLSRGLTLLLSRGLREEHLGPSHGLSTLNWGATLKTNQPDFASIVIKINSRGAFPELIASTGNRSLLRGGSSAVNFKIEMPTVLPGSTFTLGDLLSREPALQDHNHRWTGVTNCSPFAVEQVGVGKASIKLPKAGRDYVTRELGDRIFDGSQFGFATDTETEICYLGPNDQSALPGITDQSNSTFLGIGDLIITAAFSGGVKLSKIATLFGLSYTLGMLVRYFPTQWTALIRGQIDDAALPTLAAAVDFIEEKFPSVIVDFLAENAE